MTRAATPLRRRRSPCDSPFLPRDLVARLAARASCAIARSSRSRTRSRSRIRCSRSSTAACADHLAAFLRDGGRKIDAWYATLAVAAVPFDDEEAAFRNINTQDELAAAAAPLRARS